MNYLGYELKKHIVSAIKDLKFEDFSEIQKRVFNELQSDKNIIAKSKTGSGKTHAYLIPIFNAINEDEEGVFATIIAPTRELCMQIYKMAQHLASFSGKEIQVKVFTGGGNKEREIEKLQEKMPRIVIGTPGKIADLAIKENALKIYTSKYYIVDEVDMTFEQGFEEELNMITNVMNDAKKMCFSATISEHIRPYLKKYLGNASLIEVEDKIETGVIDHIWLPLKHRERYESLKGLLNTFQPYLCIIFTNSKKSSQELYDLMLQDKYNVCLINGDVDVRDRKRILREFTSLKYQFLVATDLLSRGIDIEGVSHIINYELPKEYEFYIHRSGRTARMGSDGICYSFYEDLDNAFLDFLEKRGIVPQYFEVKRGEVIPYKGRNTRENRVKPKQDYHRQAEKAIPLSNKVKPGYKKKRQREIEELAQKLKEKDKRKKK